MSLASKDSWKAKLKEYPRGAEMAMMMVLLKRMMMALLKRTTMVRMSVDDEGIGMA
jgi:hypothetical protein